MDDTNKKNPWVKFVERLLVGVLLLLLFGWGYRCGSFQQPEETNKATTNPLDDPSTQQAVAMRICEEDQRYMYYSDLKWKWCQATCKYQPLEQTILPPLTSNCLRICYDIYGTKSAINSQRYAECLGDTLAKLAYDEKMMRRCKEVWRRQIVR